MPWSMCSITTWNTHSTLFTGSFTRSSHIQIIRGIIRLMLRSLADSTCYRTRAGGRGCISSGNYCEGIVVRNNSYRRGLLQ